MSQITIEPAQGTWVVRVGGAVLGESKRALKLTEGDLPAVYYFPREDIGMAFLDQSEHKTTCPHKGTARYFTIASKSRAYVNAAWSYEDPLDAVAEIKGHLAFFVQDGVAVEQV